MITGNIINNKNQILLLNSSFFNKVLEIILNADFSKLDNGTFNLESDNFFYLIITYKTKYNINQAKAESHRKYIDFQYIIYGEELMGYAGSADSILSNVDYDAEKDIEYYNIVSDESFFILKKDMFAIFYPNEIHRPGLSNKELRSVRKIIFKIKINN